MSAFPGTPSDGFWTSSAFDYNLNSAFGVGFMHGELGTNYKTYEADVRCVRGDPEPAVMPRYERVKDETSNDWVVTDSATGLIWQGCAAPLTGETCEGTVQPYTWQEALGYCENLAFGGLDDWRLPNRRELISIVDDRRSEPSIDDGAFPHTPTSNFWSASSYADGSSSAWEVGFFSGYVYSDNKTYTNDVRCVRGGL
jgi:hypothetical protein